MIRSYFTFMTLLVLCLIVVSCIEDGYFGLSRYAYVKEMELINQASIAQIDTAGRLVNIEFPAGVDLSEIQVQKLVLSSFASSTLEVGDTINLSSSVAFETIAEDGTTYNWEIIPKVAATSPQLPNSDFQLWYQTNAGYYQPGESLTSTIWGTGNPGTALLGKFPTTPLEGVNDNIQAKMETLDNGLAGKPLKTPISAGSIFTGIFNTSKIDPADPDAAVDFGTPFAGRPAAFKIEYAYTPGSENKDRNGNVLSYDDGCDIYVLLEYRQNGEVQRLATGWFRSSDVQAEMKEIEIQLIYGELPSSTPDYKKPPNNHYVSADSAAYILPTHLIFVAASSYGGDSFEGAVGSELIIDNLQLVY